MAEPRAVKDFIYKTIGKAKYASDYLRGISRVDNEKNPFSKLNRNKDMMEVNKKHKKFMEETMKRGHIR